MDSTGVWTTDNLAGVKEQLFDIATLHRCTWEKYVENVAFYSNSQSQWDLWGGTNFTIIALPSCALWLHLSCSEETFLTYSHIDEFMLFTFTSLLPALNILGHIWIWRGNIKSEDHRLWMFSFWMKTSLIDGFNFKRLWDTKNYKQNHIW